MNKLIKTQLTAQSKWSFCFWANKPATVTVKNPYSGKLVPQTGEVYKGKKTGLFWTNVVSSIISMAILLTWNLQLPCCKHVFQVYTHSLTWREFFSKKKNRIHSEFKPGKGNGNAASSSAFSVGNILRLERNRSEDLSFLFSLPAYLGSCFETLSNPVSLLHSSACIKASRISATKNKMLQVCEREGERIRIQGPFPKQWTLQL